MPEHKKRKEDQQQSSLTPKQQQQARLQKITTYTGIGVLVIVAAIVGYYLITSRAPTTTQNAANVDFHYEAQPSLGDPQAPVKVVEFGDFKCPACKSFEEEVFLQFEQNYVNTGKVEFFFINFPLPLGDDSYTAADAGECIYHQSEAAFWAYYQAIYENQGPEQQTWATPKALLTLAREHVQSSPDVDLAALEQCLAQTQYRKEVDADKQLGISAGVNSTPTIFINKKKLESWHPYATFKAAIDKELQKSQP